MDTNCRLINGRAVCPPVHFITPRMRDQESDEYTIPHRSTSSSITIDSERTRVLIQPLFEMEPRQGLNHQRPSAPPPPPQARSLPEPPPRAPPARSLAHPPPRAHAGGGRYNLRSAKSKRDIFNGIYCNSDESGAQLCVNYSISLDDMSEELRSITTPRPFSTVAR
uniref:Uncharacterized protein n=1 Tax=Magallana gigas TaxID=29159 RepID=K1QHW6_MAGGI